MDLKYKDVVADQCFEVRSKLAEIQDTKQSPAK
jgi:hypothetical protein